MPAVNVIVSGGEEVTLLSGNRDLRDDICEWRAVRLPLNFSSHTAFLQRRT